jgi:hypothetical protein
MKVRLFLLWAAITLGIACLGFALSEGYPWGVDDGVKRLAARSFAASGWTSTVIPGTFASGQYEGFFPLPPPFVEPYGAGYRGIFPVLWEALGGMGYFLFGGFGFYLLPAAAWAAVSVFLYQLLRRSFTSGLSLWAVLLVSTALLFYGLTFWEHGLSLLLLLPLFRWIGEKGDGRGEFSAGVGLGGAAALRPEALLLLPLIWILPLRVRTVCFRRVLMLTVGAVTVLSVAAALERFLNGRWFAAQAPLNLGLWFAGGFFRRLNDTFLLFFNSPIPALYYALALGLLIVVCGKVRLLLWSALGISVLATGSLSLGVFRYGFFGVTAYSQGLFFAFPWMVVSWFKVRGKPLLRDPYWILGWGYLLLAYLGGPDRAGMHWGARFLFPAAIPLVIRTAQVLKGERAVARGITMLSLGLASAAFAGAGIGAAGERGSATGNVIETIKKAQVETLVLTRWHEGADLEPLWGNVDLFWVKGQGDAEEWLIRYAEEFSGAKIGWLNADGTVRWSGLPVDVTVTHRLPGRGGWKGEWVEIRPVSMDDTRWGEIYWHAARRRVEKRKPVEAKAMFEAAVERMPKDADLRYDYAVCLGQLGETSRALEQLDEALRLKPDHGPAGELRRRLGLR